MKHSHFVHNNNIIETFNSYDLQSSILLDSQVNAVDRAHSLSITKGCNTDVGDMTGKLLYQVLLDHLHVHISHYLLYLVIFHLK